MRCPHCKNKLLQKSGSATRLRIKGPVVFDESGRAEAHCHWCKAKVDVPIQLDADNVEVERFTLRSPDS